jgi:hypothetical protein
MPVNFDSDELLVRYHLGELSPRERDAVEDRYFADNAYHERVLAAEEELIDSYVRGELSNKQRKHFESWFLQTDDRLKKLEFAKALAGYLTVQIRRPGAGAMGGAQASAATRAGSGQYRLGDIIDDFCVRCKRTMNHAVVSVLNSEPAKVRCRTCHSDHEYRHAQPPPSKIDARKQTLFNEVLKRVNPDDGQPGEPAAEAPAAKSKTKSKK